MKKLAAGLLVCLALLNVNAAENEWLTDLDKAMAKAKAENKVVLLNFTGSDWCGWCMKFDKEVFATSQFQDYAAKNLVLVKVDFPRKTELSAEQKKANTALRDKYQAQGFPTYVILDKEGKEIGRQRGYAEGGPQPFIAKLEGFKKG